MSSCLTALLAGEADLERWQPTLEEEDLTVADLKAAGVHLKPSLRELGLDEADIERIAVRLSQFSLAPSSAPDNTGGKSDDDDDDALILEENNGEAPSLLQEEDDEDQSQSHLHTLPPDVLMHIFSMVASDWPNGGADVADRAAALRAGLPMACVCKHLRRIAESDDEGGRFWHDALLERWPAAAALVQHATRDVLLLSPGGVGRSIPGSSNGRSITRDERLVWVKLASAATKPGAEARWKWREAFYAVSRADLSLGALPMPLVALYQPRRGGMSSSIAPALFGSPHLPPSVRWPPRLAPKTAAWQVSRSLREVDLSTICTWDPEALACFDGKVWPTGGSRSGFASHVDALAPLEAHETDAALSAAAARHLGRTNRPLCPSRVRAPGNVVLVPMGGRGRLSAGVFESARGSFASFACREQGDQVDSNYSEYSDAVLVGCAARPLKEGDVVDELIGHVTKCDPASRDDNMWFGQHTVRLDLINAHGEEGCVSLAYDFSAHCAARWFRHSRNEANMVLDVLFDEAPPAVLAQRAGQGNSSSSSSTWTCSDDGGPPPLAAALSLADAFEARRMDATASDAVGGGDGGGGDGNKKQGDDEDEPRLVLPRILFRATRDIDVLEPLRCSDLHLLASPRTQELAERESEAIREAYTRPQMLGVVEQLEGLARLKERRGEGGCYCAIAL